MGVQARIVAWAGSPEQAFKAAESAFARMDQLEDVMSDYRPASEVMRLCAAPAGRPVRVSRDLFDILSLCERCSRTSDGAFDATCGPVVKMWRKARKSGSMPPADEIARNRALVGWRTVKLDRSARTATLAQPGMQLDFGGIAKGYACDEAIRVLRRHGIRSALVEMGGDIAVGDPPPGEKGWQIEAPNAPAEERMLALRNCGISSSGDTEQFVEIGGIRYSHIVDPRTGLGLTSRIAVTVVGPNARTTDGLSTAISVAGEEKRAALLNAYPGTRCYVRLPGG